MSLLGVVGLGLVWGWLAVLTWGRPSAGGAARLAWAAAGIALQGAVLVWLTRPAELAPFAAAVAGGAILHAAWLADMKRKSHLLPGR